MWFAATIGVGVAIGGVGVVSVLSNIRPGIMKSIVDSYKKGDTKTATAEHVKYNKLMRTMFVETNPVPVKRAAKDLGICEATVRLPLAQLESSSEDKLMAVLREYGIAGQA